MRCAWLVRGPSHADCTLHIRATEARLVPRAPRVKPENICILSVGLLMQWRVRGRAWRTPSALQ